MGAYPGHYSKYDQVKMLLEHQFMVPQIATLLGVSVTTVQRRMTI